MFYIFLIVFIISVHSKPINHTNSNNLINDNQSLNEHLLDLFTDNLKLRRISRDSTNILNKKSIEKLDESKKDQIKNIKIRDVGKGEMTIKKDKINKEVNDKNKKKSEKKIKKETSKDSKSKIDKIDEKVTNTNINTIDKKQTTPNTLEITKSSNVNQNNIQDFNKTKITYKEGNNDLESKNEFISTTKSIKLSSTLKSDDTKLNNTIKTETENLNENKLDNATKSTEETLKPEELTTSIAKLDDQKIISNNVTESSGIDSNGTESSVKDSNGTESSGIDSNELSNKDANQTDLSEMEKVNKTELTNQSTQITLDDKACVKNRNLNKDDEDYVDEIENSLLNDRRKLFRSRNLETHNQQSKFLIDLLGWVCIAAFGFIIGILIGLMVFSSN